MIGAQLSPESADAYAHADALTPNNPGLLADYADALGMAVVLTGERHFRH